MRRSVVCILALVLLFGAGTAVQAQMKMEMKKPEMATISGTVADLTCSAKGKAMMGSWHNAESDEHMTAEGKMAGCATMCLKGGQPAALFDGDDMVAVLACNPSATLSEFAAQEVELQGFWGGGSAKTFVPAKIRTSGGEWQEVNCATMHG